MDVNAIEEGVDRFHKGKSGEHGNQLSVPTRCATIRFSERTLLNSQSVYPNYSLYSGPGSEVGIATLYGLHSPEI